MTSVIARRWAEALILRSQATPFRGVGGYASLPAHGTDSTSPSRFPQAETELARVSEFFEFFDDPLGEQGLLRGKAVLDLGCGYGGRTVGYARDLQAREVVGVEPFPNVIARCAQFAKSLDVANCRFLVNTQETIPLPADSIDVVVLYDVFEHVEDPVAMLAEVRRVLRPGGRALLVFTPYLGAFSHHLNYVTRLPGLHWIFSPQTLVAAVNEILAGESALQRYGTVRQSPAHRSFGDRRWCTPSVNGMTGAEFSGLLGGFRVLETHATPLLAHFPVLGRPGQWLNRLIARAGDSVAEAVSFNRVCVLEKPREKSRDFSQEQPSLRSRRQP